MIAVFGTLNLRDAAAVPGYRLPLPHVLGYLLMLTAYGLNRARFHRQAAGMLAACWR